MFKIFKWGMRPIFISHDLSNNIKKAQFGQGFNLIAKFCNIMRL